LVIKEYRCSDCNRIFDSGIPSCIHCGSTSVQRIYVTPFGFKSDKTKFSDDNLEHLASSYKLGDFSNNENTKHTPEPISHWAPVKNAIDSTPGVVDVSDLRASKGGSVSIDGPRTNSRHWRAQVANEARKAKAMEKKTA
jgi:hypothetical protein